MAALADGLSIDLLFINGKPDGMVTAEIRNRLTHILVAPRTQLADALKRTEAKFVGAYLLIGELDGNPYLYVGEGKNISERIIAHHSAKDWWEKAVLITTIGNRLDQAHTKYLEMRLIAEAKSVGKVKLDNRTSPDNQPLSENAISAMEAFLVDVFLLLPALRIDSFTRNTRPQSVAKQESITDAAPEFELTSPKYSLKATARLENGELVVQAGSHARKSWDSKDLAHTYAHLHEELVSTEVLKDAGMHYVFSENYAFKSPSAAAAVILGRPTNGTTDWKLKDSSVTYKQWEADKIAMTAASGS